VGELVAGAVVIAVIAACAGLVALVRERRERADQAGEVKARRAAVWEVGEQGGIDRTRVFVRRVTAGGEEVDRIPVAEIRDGATDWEAQLLEARAQASNRAAALNSKA
jgi:chorismate mutase